MSSVDDEIMKVNLGNGYIAWMHTNWESDRPQTINVSYYITNRIDQIVTDANGVDVTGKYGEPSTSEVKKKNILKFTTFINVWKRKLLSKTNKKNGLPIRSL